MLVVATERRKRPLSVEEWSALEDNEAFWHLVERGFLGISQTGAARYEIRGQKYVGRAVAGATELVVQEKVAGTLPALLAFASGSEIVVARAQAAGADFDELSRSLIHEFVRVAGAYIANRRVPHYEYRDAVATSLRGSLDVPRTARLRARGLSHLLAFSMGSVVRNTEIDKVTLAALDGIDRAGSALGLAPETVYTARWFAGALEEVRDDAYHFLTQADLLDFTDAIIGNATTAEEDRDLTQLAAVVLLHQGFEWTAASSALVPRAWFIDLESLFEQAVRRQLQDLLPFAQVDRGEHFARRLFTSGSDTSRVNPDVVIHDDEQVAVAADVKYKSLKAGEDEEPDQTERRKKPGRPDLYQLLVHAKALAAPKALLIYPADSEYRLRHLGAAATSADTWVAEVRPWSLAEDLAAVADALDVEASA